MQELNKKILLVEDDEGSASVYLTRLEAEGLPFAVYQMAKMHSRQQLNLSQT